MSSPRRATRVLVSSVRSPTDELARGGGALSRVGANARGELGEGEWLDQVVVGARVEQADLVVDLAERAHDDDRDVRPHRAHAP